MKAMVLAAGKGSRLGDMSEKLPKPMVEVAGQPVLDHNLRWLAGAGVTEVVINLHHLGDVIRDHVGDGSQYGLAVQYSFEESLLGTAGALSPVRDVFADEPFLVVYGDNLFDFDLEKMIVDHRQNLGVATIALFTTDGHEHTGIAGGRVEIDKSGRVLRFVEGSLAPELVHVNAACYVVNPELLSWIPDGEFCDFGKDVWPRALGESRILSGHVILGRCLGIDTPEALARAHELFEHRLFA